MIDITLTCPLGHTCEKVVDGKIEQCRWYVNLEGENPQTGESVNTSKCVIEWVPIMMVQDCKETARVSDAVNVLRKTVSGAAPVYKLPGEGDERKSITNS